MNMKKIISTLLSATMFLTATCAVSAFADGEKVATKRTAITEAKVEDASTKSADAPKIAQKRESDKTSQKTSYLNKLGQGAKYVWNFMWDEKTVIMTALAVYAFHYLFEKYTNAEALRKEINDLNIDKQTLMSEKQRLIKGYGELNDWWKDKVATECQPGISLQKERDMFYRLNHNLEVFISGFYKNTDEAFKLLETVYAGTGLNPALFNIGPDKQWTDFLWGYDV
ncbi:MAG: hypothetical protein RUMPE_00201 [Eubacteriales bacterium SKADARSKE-1]|nr:hypothetical protein [Eubacteriales bacterium SKADARSKE-1]